MRMRAVMLAVAILTAPARGQSPLPPGTRPPPFDEAAARRAGREARSPGEIAVQARGIPRTPETVDLRRELATKHELLRGPDEERLDLGVAPYPVRVVRPAVVRSPVVRVPYLPVVYVGVPGVGILVARPAGVTIVVAEIESIGGRLVMWQERHSARMRAGRIGHGTVLWREQQRAIESGDWEVFYERLRAAADRRERLGGR